jgi:hypothetical protein
MYRSSRVPLPDPERTLRNAANVLDANAFRALTGTT